MQTIIRVEKLAKTFNQHQALHAVDLNIHHGEMVALLGPSGSGKSTLLRHLSGLITGDKSAGSHIELLGRTVQREGRLARDIRKSRANTGYIFQQFNLVNRLSVLENVLIGALGSTPFWRTCFSWFTREQKQRALQALTRVGMVHFAHQRVSTLSGGQQQRVAIARALMQVKLYEDIARFGHIATTYAYPVKVNGRYVMDPSPIPKFDNPKMDMMPALQLFGAGREKRIYAVPPFTRVESLDFDDHPFTVQQWDEPCAICGSTHSYLDEVVLDDAGNRMFVCSDTDYCRQQSEAKNQ